MAIRKENIQRRNVCRIQGLRIEKVVENTKNLLVAGENEDIRVYLLTEYLANMNEQGNPFVLLHSNPRFATIFENGTLNQPVICINGNNQIYDPFYQKNASVIGAMFKQLMKQDDNDVLLIINLYCTLIEKMNYEVSLQKLYEFNEKSVTELTRLANQYEISNLMKAKISDQVLRMKIQGTMLELRRQLNMLWTNDGSEKTNIFSMVSNGNCVCINMTGMGQEYLEEIIAFEINELINQGIHHCLASEEIAINSVALNACLNNGFLFKAVSGRRLSSMFTTEKEISNIMSDFDRLVILKHNLTNDCDIFSKAIGTYRFIRETTGSGTNRMPLQIIRSHHVERTSTEEDRQRLLPEDIVRLDEDGAFIYYSDSSKIIEANLIY